MTILLPEHPLANLFSVGPDAPPERQAAAAEVLGFALGQVVTCRFRSQRGQSATVVRLNPADCEVGVTVRDPHRVLWCTRSELVVRPDDAQTGPRSRATAGDVDSVLGAWTDLVEAG